MQNSMIVFLINDEVRAIRAVYEDGAKPGIFKTMDPNIQVDDLVVVQSTTRHEMTVVKVTEVDIDLDYDTATDIKWVVQRIDNDGFKDILGKERDAITAVQTAERRRKREELRASLFNDHEARIKELAIAHSKDDGLLE